MSQRSRRGHPNHTGTNTEITHVSSGVDALDDVLQGGFLRSGMTMIASRPKACSNSLLIGATIRALKQSLSVVYVSDRLKEEQVRGRMVLSESKINGYLFNESRGDELNSERDALYKAHAAIDWTRLELMARRTVDITELHDACFKARPALVVADFQPGRVHDGSSTGYRVLESGLKALARTAEQVNAAVAVRVVLPEGIYEPDRLELPGLGSAAELFEGVVLLHRAEDSEMALSSQVEARVVRLEGRDIRARRVPMSFEKSYGGLSGLSKE